MHLVPGERRRDGRAGPRPHRVDDGRRLAGAVLVRVDEHAAPLSLRPLGGDEARVRPLERAGDHRGEGARRIEALPAGDRNEHVDPARAARLRKALEPREVEELLDEQRHLDHLREADVVGRVEVEHDPVGPVGLVDARRPGVHVDAAHVDHPEEREVVVDERVVDDPLLAVAGRGRERRAPDPVRHVRRRVLLEEELALPAVGVALHRERPVVQVWHEDGSDVAVVREQVALRDALVRPEGLVEVRQLEDARSAADLGRHRHVLGDHLVSQLILAQAEVNGRPQPAVPRPLGELDLGDERRLDPGHVAAAHLRHLRLLGERRSSSRRSGFRSIFEPIELAIGEPGADVARVAEPVGCVDAEHERADPARAAALAARVAGDDELLAALQLQLAPVRRAAAGPVLRVGQLRDDALEPVLARGPLERGTVVERRRDEDAGRPKCRRAARAPCAARCTSGR